jgi:hypothetical protein
MRSRITRYYARNPTYLLLFGTRGPVHAAAKFGLFLTALIGLTVLICSIDGTLHIEGEDVGLTEDWFHPAMLLMFVWIHLACWRMFRDVEHLMREMDTVIITDDEHRTVGISRTQLHAQVRHIRRTMSILTPSSKRWYAAALGFMVLLVLTFQISIPLFAPQPAALWGLLPDDEPLTYIVVGIPWAVFMWVAMVGNFLWHTASMAVPLFSMIHRHTRAGRLRVVPLAPDGRAGLSSIGLVAFDLSLAYGAGLLPVAGWILCFGVDLPLIAGFAVYLVFLTAAFFGPLLAIHTSMKNAKQRELQRISRMFRAEYRSLSDVREKVDAGAPVEVNSQLRESVASMGALEQLYRRAEQMPVWPFDSGTLGKFMSLIGIPIALMVFERLTST